MIIALHVWTDAHHHHVDVRVDNLSKSSQLTLKAYPGISRLLMKNKRNFPWPTFALCRYICKIDFHFGLYGHRSVMGTIALIYSKGQQLC